MMNQPSVDNPIFQLGRRYQKIIKWGPENSGDRYTGFVVKDLNIWILVIKRLKSSHFIILYKKRNLLPLPLEHSPQFSVLGSQVLDARSRACRTLPSPGTKQSYSWWHLFPYEVHEALPENIQTVVFVGHLFLSEVEPSEISIQESQSENYNSFLPFSNLKIHNWSWELHQLVLCFKFRVRWQYCRLHCFTASHHSVSDWNKDSQHWHFKNILKHIPRYEDVNFLTLQKDQCSEMFPFEILWCQT